MLFSRKKQHTHRLTSVTKAPLKLLFFCPAHHFLSVLLLEDTKEMDRSHVSAVKFCEKQAHKLFQFNKNYLLPLASD